MNPMPNMRCHFKGDNKKKIKPEFKKPKYKPPTQIDE